MKPASKRFNILNHYTKFDSHGNGVIINGRVRSGKTTLVSIFVKQLLDNGFAVISNVRFADSVFAEYQNKLFYITSDLDFFNAYITIPDNIPMLLVWDDAQASEGMKSTQILSKSGNDLSKFLIFIGKFETNYMYIAHQKYIPDTLTRGFEPIIIYKLNRAGFYIGNSEFYTSEYEIRRNCYYAHIPPLDKIGYLPILSKAPATFEFKLDLSALFKYLSEYSIGENLKRGVAEFLKFRVESDGHTHLRSLTYQDIITALWLKRDKKLTGKEKLYQIVNPQILYSTLDKLKRGI